MIEKGAEDYLNECLEIGAAMESLIHLSDIVDDIATEASYYLKGEEEPERELKKAIAMQQMTKKWLEKYRQWESKMDMGVAVSPDIKLNKIENEIMNMSDTIWHSWTTYLKDDDDAFTNKDLEDGIKNHATTIKTKLQAELDKVKAADKAAEEPIVKTGLFKSARAKLANVIRNISKDSKAMKRADYAKRLQNYIKSANIIMSSMDRTADAVRTDKKRKADAEAIQEKGNEIKEK